MSKVSHESWDEIHAGHFQVNVDDWELAIYNNCDQLNYCEQCVSPDGRRWSLDSGDRFGTDPVALLSTWEHQTLDGMLKGMLSARAFGSASSLRAAISHTPVNVML
jgi:hypothetical protein